MKLFERWKARRADLRERELFLTHTPDAYSVGLLRDGYVITKIERTTPTALASGGAAPCWRVLGRKAEPARVF